MKHAIVRALRVNTLASAALAAVSVLGLSILVVALWIGHNIEAVRQIAIVETSRQNLGRE